MSSAMRERFLEGPALRPARDVLAAEGYPVEIQGGCLVFVRAHQYEDVMKAVEDEPLRYGDILYNRDLDYLVGEILDLSRDQSGAWISLREVLPIGEAGHTSASSTSNDTGAVIDGVIEIDRTFLRWRPVVDSSNQKARSY